MFKSGVHAFGFTVSDLCPSVAKKGSWIPAFAGMTNSQRIPGNMPFIERIIFAIPPLDIIFIIF